MVELQDRISEILREAERQTGEPRRAEVVLDMAETQGISSHFVNEMIRINLRLRMSERRLRLINVPPNICEVLKLLRLDRSFDCEPAPCCVENEQASPTIKQRRDAAEKSATFFLRKFASRFALRSLQ